MKKLDLWLNVVTGTDPNDAIREVFVDGSRYTDFAFEITNETDVFHLAVMERGGMHRVGMFLGEIHDGLSFISETFERLMAEKYPDYRFVGSCDFVAPWACAPTRFGLTWKWVRYQPFSSGSYCLRNSKPCDYMMNWESAKHPATS